MVLPALFRFFSQLMIAYYTPGSKTPREVAAWVGVSDWQAERNIVPAMRLLFGAKGYGYYRTNPPHGRQK